LINHELKLGVLFDRQIGWFSALQDLGYEVRLAVRQVPEPGSGSGPLANAGSGSVRIAGRSVPPLAIRSLPEPELLIARRADVSGGDRGAASGSGVVVAATATLSRWHCSAPMLANANWVYSAAIVRASSLAEAY
jgi:hypothetical protein